MKRIKELLKDTKIGELKSLLPKVIFGQGTEIETLYLDSKLDGNGYFTRLVIAKREGGEYELSLKEGACKKLRSGWVIHPGKWREHLQSKTFASAKELEFIMNSEIFKRRVSTVDLFYVESIS